MAQLTISEFQHLGSDGFSSSVLAPMVPPLNEQTLLIDVVATTSTAFQDRTRFILVNCDIACCLGWGQSPVALNNKHRLGANETRFYTVKAGDALAVIASPT